MVPSTSLSAPFTPLLLLRPLLRPLPRKAACHLLNLALFRLHRNYPGVASRLQSIDGKTFLIAPAEFPFAIMAQVSKTGMMKASLAEHPMSADVYVKGTLAGLIEMLEGESDGDALFFSRQLQVEGDTEALLTLRNALDSENVRVASLLIPTHMQKAASKAQPFLRRVYQALGQDMAAMESALNGKLAKQYGTLFGKQQNLEQQLAELQEKLSQQTRQLHQLQKKGELNAHP